MIDIADGATSIPTVPLLGLNFHAITEQQCIDHILNALERGRGGWVITPNLAILRRCVHDETIKRLVEQADLVVADGMPLVWASRLQRSALPQRVAGSSLISTLSAAAASRARRVFLLGGAPGTADAAAAVLRERYSGLHIVGTHCPPPGFEADPVQMRATLDVLANSQPDIIYVALGSPKQEQFIAAARHVCPHAWWLGIGISFSFLCGQVRRAPQWMQRCGLEWLHRLCQEPRRLTRRYLVEGIPFAGRLLAGAAWQGMTSGGRHLHHARPYR